MRKILYIYWCHCLHRWSMLVWFRASFSPSLKHPGTSQTIGTIWSRLRMPSKSPAECLRPFHHSTLRFLKEINRPDLQFEAAWVLLLGSMLQRTCRSNAVILQKVSLAKEISISILSIFLRCWQTLHREMRIRLEWWWSMPGSWEFWHSGNPTENP